MSLSDKEQLQLAKVLDKVLEARENQWIEINNVLVYKILKAFSEQLADCMKAQTTMLYKAITGREAGSVFNEESERLTKMMMDTIKK